MGGRYLPWAIKKKRNYVGIDIVPKYIDAAKEAAKDIKGNANRYLFFCWDAADLHLLLSSNNIPACPEDCLAFFPFNSFGNMTNISAVIRSLALSRMSFVISSYKTDNTSTKIRKEYYENCRYRQLHACFSEKGVRFLSPDGLDTIAYRQGWLTDKFRRSGIEVQSISFAKLGLLYAFIKPRTKEI